MNKLLYLPICAALILPLVACDSSTAPETVRSAELLAQFPIYDKAAKEIKRKMNVTAEQADDIFIILADCGMDKDISYIIGNNSSYTISTGKVGEGVVNYTVKLDNGIVKEVESSLKVLYPASVVEETADNSADIILDTLEAAVDSAIEKADAVKENVLIGNEVVSIYLKGTEHLTTAAVRRGMFIQARDILKALQEREDISKITLFWTYMLIDDLGNEKEETVMKIQLEKDTFQSINFDKFDWNKFPDIADDYFEHTALSN